jgi:methylmalonyl-CoA mutase C-terminal domain/subunit
MHQPISERVGASPTRAPRVVIAKVGLDGHDRGARLVANALRAAGMEVVYTGLRRTIDQVVDTVIEHRADYLDLSLLAGDHMIQTPKVIAALKARGAGDTKVTVGGIIARQQVPELLAHGVRQVFLPGTPLAEIEKFIVQDFGIQQ